MRRLVLAAWTGSSNLGDELLVEALRRRVEPLGATIEAISVDPARTTADHGIAAVDEHRPDRVARAIRQADGLVFGPGGLLQDDSSSLNPSRHLWRVAAARRAGVPVVAVGLGVGPLTGRINRRLAARALADRPVNVRDQRSADALADIGVAGATVTADLVFGLDPPTAAPADRIVVCLRPPTARRFLPERRADRVARLTAPARRDAVRPLADLARRLDLPVRFVSFEAGRDDVVAGAIADDLASQGVDSTVVVPSRHDVLDEVAASRLVVTMRYHGGVAAIMARRPAVLVGHVDKVRALVDQAAVPGIVGIEAGTDGWSTLPTVGAAALDAAPTVADADGALRAAESGNVAFLAEHLGGGVVP